MDDKKTNVSSVLDIEKYLAHMEARIEKKLIKELKVQTPELKDPILSQFEDNNNLLEDNNPHKVLLALNAYNKTVESAELHVSDLENEDKEAREAAIELDIAGRRKTPSDANENSNKKRFDTKIPANNLGFIEELLSTFPKKPAHINLYYPNLNRLFID